MTIIVLWIFLSIIALIVILLHFSVSAYLKIDGDGFVVKVKYFFFTLYPLKPKKSKQKKVKKKAENRNSEKTQDFSDDLDDELDEIKEELAFENVTESSDSAESEEVVPVQTQDSEKTEAKTSETAMENKPTSKAVKKEKHKEKKSKNKNDKKESKLSSLKEQYYKYKPYFPMGWKYFKKLLKTIRLTGVKIEINVGREDAHEAAIYYGAVQGVVFNTLGQICNMFSVKIKKADVNCIFAKNIINGKAECYIKVRPSALIAIAFCVGVNFLIVFLRQKRKNKNKQEKTNEKVLEVK